MKKTLFICGLLFLIGCTPYIKSDYTLAAKQTKEELSKMYDKMIENVEDEKDEKVKEGHIKDFRDLMLNKINNLEMVYNFHGQLQQQQHQKNYLNLIVFGLVYIFLFQK